MATKKKSDVTVDADNTPPVLGAADPEVGTFVAIGVEFVSRDSGEWTVDPETGLVTGKV